MTKLLKENGKDFDRADLIYNGELFIPEKTRPLGADNKIVFSGMKLGAACPREISYLKKLGFFNAAVLLPLLAVGLLRCPIVVIPAPDQVEGKLRQESRFVGFARFSGSLPAQG